MYKEDHNATMVSAVDLSFIQQLITMPPEKKLLLQGVMIGLELNNGLPSPQSISKRDSADSPKQAHV